MLPQEPSLPQQDMWNDDSMMDNEELPNMEDENLPSMNDNNEMSSDNEEGSPKNEIQKVTGKLSQLLNDYNSKSNDSELNKYVINMIVKQVTKGLSQDDKDEVISKIENSENEDFNNQDMTDDSMNEELPMNESVNLQEFINNFLNDKEDNKKNSTKIPQKLQNKQNPFISNR